MALLYGNTRTGRQAGGRTWLWLIVALVAVAGCSSAQPPRSAANASPTPGNGQFLIKAYTFPALTAAPGQKLSLIDGDSEPHSVTADDGTFDSGSFDNTAPGSLVAPTKPGSYPMHCTIHPTMHGTLTVA